jgi:hypothetical protein
MKKQQHVFIQYLSSILGVCVFIALLVFAIIMLSYLFIIAAVIGLILFVIIFIRIKYLKHKYRDHINPNASKIDDKPGRTIDQ